MRLRLRWRLKAAAALDGGSRRLRLSAKLPTSEGISTIHGQTGQNTSFQCCGSKYIEFGSGSGSGILVQTIFLGLKSDIFCLYFIIYFTCVDPDPYSEQGSAKLLNTDPMRIQVHNTACISTEFHIYEGCTMLSPPPHPLLKYPSLATV